MYQKRSKLGELERQRLSPGTTYLVQCPGGGTNLGNRESANTCSCVPLWRLNITSISIESSLGGHAPVVHNIPGTHDHSWWYGDLINENVHYASISQHPKRSGQKDGPEDGTPFVSENEGQFYDG